MSCLLVSCNNNNKVTLDKLKVVHILTDMHILAQGLDRKSEDFDSLYNEFWTIIEMRHDITREEFISYYDQLTLDTRKMDEIYDDVVDSLGAMEIKHYRIEDEDIKTLIDE